MDFSVSSSPDSHSRTSLVWVIIIGSVLLLLIIIGVVFLTQRSRGPPVVPRSIQPPSTENVNTYSTPIPVSPNGISSIDGSLSEPMICSQDLRHRQWIVDANGRGSCQCKFPFTGPNCQDEQVDPNYRDAGSTSGYKLSPLYTTRVDSLSLGSGITCTSLCDRSTGCSGITYDGSNCTLVTGKIIYNPRDSGTNSVPTSSNLYLKKGVHSELANSLVVYSGTLPPRYWSITNSTNPANPYQILEPSNIYQLNFYPSRVMGNSTLTGILSLQPLPSDYSTLMSYIQSPPNNIALLPPNSGEVTIPTRWLPLPINPSLYLVFL